MFVSSTGSRNDATKLLPGFLDIVEDQNGQKASDVEAELSQARALRWTVLSESSVDEIDENRHSKHTATQTRCASIVFQG